MEEDDDGDTLLYRLYVEWLKRPETLAWARLDDMILPADHQPCNEGDWNCNNWMERAMLGSPDEGKP